MTNGEIIQKDFNCEVCEPIIEDDIIHVIFADKKDSAIGFDWSWWNAEHKDPTTKNNSPKYCDRNICLKNEYNNIGCEDCEVSKSQEPTTKNDLGVDCISREEVIDIVENTTTEWLKGDVNFMYPSLINKIKGLPPVTPQTRKGHWISTETKGVRYAFWCRYKCSLCGELSDYTNFCPNCGADMREEEVAEVITE